MLKNYVLAVYCVRKKTKREKKRLQGELTKEVHNHTVVRIQQRQNFINTKQSFLSSCLQPTSVAPIKAFNQIIRRKHQKGLSSPTNSFLCITARITTLYCTERMLILMSTYVKTHYKIQFTSFLSSLPAYKSQRSSNSFANAFSARERQYQSQAKYISMVEPGCLRESHRKELLLEKHAGT